MKKLKILIGVVVVLQIVSAGYAENIFDMVVSPVKATLKGLSKTISNANPGKIVSNVADGTKEAVQKGGEASIGAVTNTAGVISGGN